MKRIVTLFLCNALLCNGVMFANTQSGNVIRAAIDIGSAGPKLRVAEVNVATNRIEKIIHIKKYFVPFVASLSQSEESSFTPEIMEQGLVAFQDAVSVAQSFGSSGIVALATSSFRAAKNGQQFAEMLQQATQVPVHIVDQQLEGELAFQAALAQVEIDSRDLVVWDIGSSMQFVGIGETGDVVVDGSDEGSWSFKNHIVENIQGHSAECRSPNPMSRDDVSQAEYYARGLATKVDRMFKDKINRIEFGKPVTEVVGVGSVFGNGIVGLMGKSAFTRDELSLVVKGFAEKTDADFGGGDYACVEASNAIFAFGFMQELNIQQIRILDVNNADGALVYGPFWK